jgi:hypothetical protein
MNTGMSVPSRLSTPFLEIAFADFPVLPEASNGAGWDRLHGMNRRDSLPLLRHAVNHMTHVATRPAYKALEAAAPEGYLGLLRQSLLVMIWAAEIFPDEEWHIQKLKEVTDQ